MNHETEREKGPVPSVVTLMVAVAVVGPVCRNPDTVTSLTAGAAGGAGEAVVGVAVLSAPPGGVVASGSPAEVAEAEGEPAPVATGPEGDSPGDDAGSAVSVGVEDRDGEADEVGAAVPAGSAPGWALVVARACAAPCEAVPGAFGMP